MNELELILTDIFKRSRTQLYLDSSRILFHDSELKKLDNIFKKRAKAYPIQYILGYAEFMGLRLKVNKDVLIPRPETEILVEEVIKQTKGHRLKIKDFKVLDIGTSSGNIAVSLAIFLTNVEIVTVDISREAQELAKENSRIHNVDKKIKFLHSDLFSHSFFSSKINFDIIVSNPPYVPSDEIGLFEITTKREPRGALDGGKDGLDFYRRLNKEFRPYLKKNGIMILEIGFGQSQSINEIFGKHNVKFIRDYQNIERVAIISNG